MPQLERWHRLKPEAQGAAVCDIADHLWDDSSGWRDRLLEATRWYEGFRVSELSAEAYRDAPPLREKGEFDAVYWNTPRSLVQALTAKIAGRQRPKPQFVCTDTDWATKRRAKRLERFAEACLYQRQGQYRDSWDLGVRMFIDSAVWGTGVLKVYPDLERMTIPVERAFIWEVLIDPLEAECGDPLNLFHRYHYDKDRLAARFPKFADKIMTAKSNDGKRGARSGHLRNARQCLVHEAWRLPIGGDDEGRHVIAIDGTTLVSEPWERDEFPFLFQRYTPHMLGFGATGLVEEAMPMARELNATIERMREGERKLAAGAISWEDGSIDEDKIADAKIGALLPRKPGTAPPTIVQPEGFSDSTLSWMRLHYDKSFELTGVSQMGATSRKEPGVTAGVALRTIAQMETERFAVQYGAYEQTLAVDLCRHNIACARQVAKGKDGKKAFVMRWPGRRFLREIDWEKADLDDEKYYMQGHAVAGLVNTPADRLQLGQDLFNAGTISEDAFLRITQLKDVDAELKTKNVQHELVEDYIEQWLEATPEGEEEGTFRYRAPIPFMNHAEAILQVATAYMQAELDNAPDWNLDLFARFITQCSNLISPPEQQIPLGPGAPPPPPAMPVPGAPGGAPMPPPSGGPSQMLN